LAWLVESRMRGNTHVRFGGAGRGNGPFERTALRPGPIPTGGTDPCLELTDIR